MAGLGEIPPGTDLTGMPAADPPTGIDANFENPENRGPAYIAVGTVCMAVATSFVFTRLYTRFFVLKAPWWDDLVLVLALLCQAAYCGLNIWLCLHGVGKQIYNVYMLDFLSLLDPAQIMAIMTEPAIGFTKLALLMFFYRLFKSDKKTKVGLLIGMGIIIVTYTTLFFLFIFLEYAHIARCNQAMAVLNIATDFYILILPIPVVMGLQLPAKKKYALIGLFSTGFLCCVLSIIGAYYRWMFSNDLTNFTWDLWNVITVNTIECAVGIICACLPVFPALLKSGPFSGRWLTPVRSVRDRLRGTNRTMTGPSSHNTSRNYTRVEDDNMHPSIELGHQRGSFTTDSDKSLVKPSPAAHRAHPSRTPPRNHVVAEPPEYRTEKNMPTGGIEVRRDWTVNSQRIGE